METTIVWCGIRRSNNNIKNHEGIAFERERKIEKERKIYKYRDIHIHIHIHIYMYRNASNNLFWV